MKTLCPTFLSAMVAVFAPLEAFAQAEAPRASPAAPDGTVQVPSFRAPYSPLASEAAKRNFVEFSDGFARLRQALQPDDSIEVRRQKLDVVLMKPGVDRLRAAFPVTIRSETVGRVGVDVVLPAEGVSARNRDRVLINLHGGGMTWGGGYGGQQESIPIASLGRIKVVSIDYRMAPRHAFPAASEDVAAVYRELLKVYRPQSIGIYGCSAGGNLTAQSVAWFQKEGLPRPGAIGLFGAGMTPFPGDSDIFAVVLGGLGGVPLTAERLENVRPGNQRPTSGYLRGADLSDPLVFPANSPGVLRKFPPTLLISGTRDLRLSQTVRDHAQLWKAGVDARLHVWEGAPHCSFAQPVVDPTVPETREAWEVIVKFFDAHLQ